MKSPALYILFFISGISGLGYEILWTRMLSVSLGHEIVSVLAVVSAFFGGLAIGAWFLDRPVSRSNTPGRWYALLEMAIGLWAVALIFILPNLNSFISGLIGETPAPLHHWLLSFLYPFVLLLPAAFAMGGTLPAIDRFIEKVRNNRHAVAGLYSVNTFGAVAGTLLVTFMVLPALGMNKTSIVLALGNFLCALGILLLARAEAPAHTTEATLQKSASLAVPRLYAVLFVTGLMGIGFEVLVVRVLSQILENTVFSFAAMLMVFLFGTAVGAGVYQKTRKYFDSEQTLSLMLLSTALLCLISIFSLRYVEPFFSYFQKLFGEGFYGAVAAELSLALLVFLLPTVSMGATFSHLALALKDNHSGVGKALCLNTLGAAIAPFLFGVILLPGIGIKYSLLVIPFVYLLCMPKLRSFNAAAGAVIGFFWIVIALQPNSYQFVSISEGDTLVFHKEGIMASVSVIQDRAGEHHLKVNNHFQMGGTTSAYSDRRQAYLPLLLHPEPKQALFLGLGTGSTFAGAAEFPELKADGVELVPEVVEVMSYFKEVTGDLSENANLNIIQADARRYVTATDKKYDVVIADLFHPARDGAGSLYTKEHFEAIEKLLTENGLFCQWLPLYQLDLEMFKVIANTFLQVFPEGQAYLAHYSIDQPIIGLVGGKRKLCYSESWYEERIQEADLKRRLSGFGYDSNYSLLGSFMAEGHRLRAFVNKSPVNTDENPVVLFQAPFFIYGKQSPPRERLSALLAAFASPDPESILSESDSAEALQARSRLSAYWTARDSFLKLGMGVERTNDVARLYVTASEPLLDIVRKSIDFSEAYKPLISIAYEIFPYDRDASYRLLIDMEKANPYRSEATFLKQRLFTP